jgi:hypothetical protein
MTTRATPALVRLNVEDEPSMAGGRLKTPGERM